MSRNVARKWLSVVAFVALGTAASLVGAQEEHPSSELIGMWKGTSVCTDRVAAPACKDEVVVYEFTGGEAAGTVHWKADKVVDDERLTMGEFDLAWDEDDGCWKGEFRSARVHTVWCISVKDGELTGSGWLLPDKQTVRKIDARRDFGESRHRAH